MTTRRYTAAELAQLPTLAVGQADDLKIDDCDGTRVWLSRVTPNEISVEWYSETMGCWLTTETYEG